MKPLLLTFAQLLCISVIVSLTIYALDLEIFASSTRLTPSGVAFLEGIVLIILGTLFFIGSGGISRTTSQAAMLNAAANAVFGDQTTGPAETYRRDTWKPKGFPLVATVLILSGVFLIIIYFVQL